MKKNNQKGFGAVEVLLILVLIGLIGGVGWYVWSKNKSTTTSATTQPAQTTVVTTKSKYTEYVNKEFGFKFSYPTEWGTVKVKPSLAIGKQGKAYDIVIGTSDKLLAGFVTKDWVVGTSDATAVGFTAYDECVKLPSDLAQTYLYKTDTACVSVIVGKDNGSGSPGTESNRAELVLQNKFSKNQQIAGLQFYYAPVAIKDLKTATLEKAYTNGGISDGFVEIAKTAQEL